MSMQLNELFGSRSVRLSVNAQSPRELQVEARELSEQDAEDDPTSAARGSDDDQSDAAADENLEAIDQTTALPFLNIDDYHDAVKASSRAVIG
jgi:hypothetical protein